MGGVSNESSGRQYRDRKCLPIYQNDLLPHRMTLEYGTMFRSLL